MFLLEGEEVGESEQEDVSCVHKYAIRGWLRETDAAEKPGGQAGPRTRMVALPAAGHFRQEEPVTFSTSGGPLKASQPGSSP